MKRFAILMSLLAVVFAIPAIAQERSPDSSHVLRSPVPQDCLTNGWAERGHIKYTCTKVDSSDVWNEMEAESFQKDIYEAYQKPIVTEPATTRVGLIVKQDSVRTASHVETKVETVTAKETAYVEQRQQTQNYKYRYAKK